MEAMFGTTRVVLKRGDITREDTDAIVNAANTTLLGGGGVDGAIHRAGGTEILAECREIVARQGGCPTGEAVITTGGKLKAKHVIHTVGPVWSGGGRGEENLLRAAYRNCMKIVSEHQLQSVAFPSISTGAYRFPIVRAAETALEEIWRFVGESMHEVREIRFVLFSDGDLAVYEAAGRRIIGQ
jgi:O-acetyl-ADP-ribose deacetylase (regulator of RNase III)